MKEICVECGKSVKMGSGNFVNRIPIFDDLDIRIEQNRPYPEGEWVCSVCDEVKE